MTDLPALDRRAIASQIQRALVSTDFRYWEALTRLVDAVDARDQLIAQLLEDVALLNATNHELMEQVDAHRAEISEWFGTDQH